MSYLRLENISKNFGQTKALGNVTVNIEEGEFCVVLGPSGCGKSTLLNIVAGLEDPSSGKVYLGGKDITTLTPRRRDMAMVFQNYALYPHLSVFENMAFGLRARRIKKKEIEKRVREASEILNISDKLKKHPRELSGGERQRVATGRAIVREPKVFLFDEPLSNLDARLRVELRKEFIKLHRRLKKTILYVTHDQVEATVLGKKVVVLRDGDCEQISTPRDLYEDPQNLFVAGFIGTPPMNIIRMRILEPDGKLVLSKGNFSFELPEKPRELVWLYAGKEIYLGIRSSAIQIDQKGPLKAEVIFTEMTGEDIFALIRLADGIELIVKIDRDLVLKPGQSVNLSFDSTKMYFFDGFGNRIK